MALNLLDECYNTVSSKDVPAPFGQKVEMLRTVAKFADLEPKQSLTPAGTGFSIKIIYSGDRKPGSVTIDQEISFDAQMPAYLAPSLTTDMLGLMTPSDE